MMQKLRSLGTAVISQLALKNKKGNSLFNWVLGSSGVLIILGIVAFVIATLEGAITNASASTIYNNTLTMFTNFTAQLGTIGTLAGVLLIFGVLGAAGIGLWMGYQKVRGGGYM